MIMDSVDEGTALVVFQGRGIRRVWHGDEWWFVLEDIVSVLTDSKDPKQYLNKMRQRDEPLSEGWVQIVHTLSVDTAGGKQKMNCVNTRGAFRLIQSIPSSKAEPFKRWLAKVGYERIQEIEDPEIAMKRMREIYLSKGYSEDWIEKRARGIAHQQLETYGIEFVFSGLCCWRLQVF
jgi:DNA-damage-inducible protein D